MAAGRPTDYKPEYCEQVTKLCKLGATDKEMANFFEVSEQTFNAWKHEYPQFLESIKAGKIKADAEVAASLYRRATGYQYREITFEKLGPGEDQIEVGETGMEAIEQELYKKKVTVKEMPPDVAAQNIWLKNRRGRVPDDAQKWADKQEVGLTDNDGNDVPPVQIVYQLPDNKRDA
jgi:hypothetical protein